MQISLFLRSFSIVRRQDMRVATRSGSIVRRRMPSRLHVLSRTVYIRRDIPVDFFFLFSEISKKQVRPTESRRNTVEPANACMRLQVGVCVQTVKENGVRY